MIFLKEGDLVISDQDAFECGGVLQDTAINIVISGQWSVVGSQGAFGGGGICHDTAIDFVIGGRWSVVGTRLAAEACSILPLVI